MYANNKLLIKKGNCRMFTDFYQEKIYMTAFKYLSNKVK